MLIFALLDVSLLLLIAAAYVAANPDDNKYFHEPGEDSLHRHYDTRFFKDIVSDEERQVTLTTMIKAYLLLFDNLKLDTWIAHGTLLGWWWNEQILPWVTNATLFELAHRHNHTYHEYHSPRNQITRKYLLDVNPWSWERIRGDGANIIDARFIDVSNGLFLDITGLSANDPNNTNVIECKNEHKYNITEIFPLRDSIFEGVSVKVPYAYTKILADEYSDHALRQTGFHNHTFMVESGEWKITEERSQYDKEEVAPSGGAFS